MDKQQPTEYEVTCVVIEGDRVAQIGGRDWGRKMLSDVIYEIGFGSTFFTNVDGKRANIEVKRDENDNPYLSTDRDDETTNNLLSLPDCP
jgi:uncharacterized protein DUF3892